MKKYILKNLVAHVEDVSMAAFAIPACRQAGQMNVVWHNNKGIQSNSLIFYKEPKAVYNYIFILVVLKQLIPSFYAGCKELRIFSNKNRHLLS